MSWSVAGGSSSWSVEELAQLDDLERRMVSMSGAATPESDTAFRARLTYVVGHEIAHLHGKQLDDLAETLGLRRRGV